ncbi:DUF2635 domain-containing protein [Candidatus Williamhamiltonella defendens]|uniref:DUF2635 domain-containing protein n=1 Tax=Candidatus Williamhamiltonella defendens TaxID=138072 RepID=UPI00130DD258|nr:DUF2635 domain-containing protein [Candidatus Hamiltonella defensa]
MAQLNRKSKSTLKVKFIFVKQRKSCEVRDPFKRTLLPNEGAEVLDSNLFWQPRVRNKDIIVLTKKENKPKMCNK